MSPLVIFIHDVSSHTYSAGNNFVTLSLPHFLLSSFLPFPSLLLFPPLLSFTHSVPPIVVPLAPGRQVIGNETGSVTLSFRIDNAAPPVLLQDLRWFYVANFRIDDPYAGQEITSLVNRTTESTLTFSNFTDMRYVSLTVSNILQQREGLDGETDQGRYFLVATNPAGVTFSYIDLLVYGKYMYICT